MPETPPFSMIREFLSKAGVRAWIAGGTVRDLLLGRPPQDIDIVTETAPEISAREFADVTGGSFFTLSEEFRTCRVLSSDRKTSYDFSELTGGGIEADLGRRDFTINAMAMELAGEGDLVDPLGGRSHLEARLLVPVNASIFKQDPLRMLRAVRFEKKLNVAATSELEELIRADAGLAANPSPERIFFELTGIIEPPGAPAAVRRFDDLGLLEVVLPEVSLLKGLAQNEFHHLDVFNHVLEASGQVERIIEDPATIFPEAAARIQQVLKLPVAGDAGRKQILGLAALFHDIGKPGCRGVNEAGRVRFFKHEQSGSVIARDILSRLKASNDVSAAVFLLVSQHMRLSTLPLEGRLSSRASLRYLKATSPYTPETIILSVADVLSALGPASTAEVIERRLEIARELMSAHFAEEEAEPLPRLIGGDELMRELDLKPGPLIGEILDHIEEEQRLGNIASRQEAVAAARIIAGGHRSD